MIPTLSAHWCVKQNHRVAKARQFVNLVFHREDTNLSRRRQTRFHLRVLFVLRYRVAAHNAGFFSSAIASLFRLFLFFSPLLGQRIRLSFRGKHAEFPAKCGRKEARAAGENCQTVVTSAPVCRWLMTVIFRRIRWPDWHERDPHRLLYINGTTVATRDAAQLPCLLLRHQLRPSTRNTVTRRRISADLGFPWNHSSQGVCLHTYCHFSKVDLRRFRLGKSNYQYLSRLFDVIQYTILNIIMIIMIIMMNIFC